MVTDCCVHPYPDGDTSLRRMALEAGALGFDSIVAQVRQGSIYQGIRIIPAAIIAETDARKVSGRLKRAGGEGVLVMVNAGENGFNRAVLNISGLHILRQVHRTQKNSFDHIAARTATSRNVAIDIDLYPLIHDTGTSRQKVLQRYQDIMTLRSRYRFPLTLSSNACSWLDLRSVDDMYHLCGLIGMDEGEVREALETADDLLMPSRPAREVL
ncbi:MAG: ribonuclease P [Methanoregulaceae archaeon]|jgi:ribonuclease P/MRP protein subunit RPP1|nr:ribonuclease P [Methanoregulaceae archaeon]